MQNTLRKDILAHSFLFGLFLLAGSLPYSKFLMSLSLIIMFISWLLDGNLKEKMGLFIKNRTALVLSSLFILHAIGLLYTSDLAYGFEDVKKKIPLMLLPLLFSTSAPLSKQMFERILSVFTLSVVIATLICFAVLIGFTSKRILHPQEASIFMSHIRFGLLISLSVFIIGYFIPENKSVLVKVLLSLLVIWLIAFLIMMESATGLVCTLAGLFFLCIRFIFQTKNIPLKIGLFTILFLAGLSAMKMYHSVASDFELSSSPVNTQMLALTPSGNPYAHDTLNNDIENGNYIWRNVCEAELESSWNIKSRLSYSGKDLRGNELKFTLIRFLTSKGLTKDAESVNSLSTEEIQAIEKGVANVNYISVFNPAARLQKIMWEFHAYLSGGNPSGHSVVQRIEFWKAAAGIIRENPFFGVGTGDVKNAFEKEYDKISSPLTKEWRLRSHNQFLAIATAFGLTGLAFFLFTLIYPLFGNKKLNDYLYLMFFIIGLLSMLTEDTLESQAGVTFFAFFNSFLLFLHKDPKQTDQP